VSFVHEVLRETHAPRRVEEARGNLGLELPRVQGARREKLGKGRIDEKGRAVCDARTITN
jgi:hypothetical protein